MNDSYLTIYTWNFIPDVPGVPDLQLGLLLGTGGRLCVHKAFRKRSVTTYGRLVCFQHTPCVVGVRFYL